MNMPSEITDEKSVYATRNPLPSYVDIDIPTESVQTQFTRHDFFSSHVDIDIPTDFAQTQSTRHELLVFRRGHQRSEGFCSDTVHATRASLLPTWKSASDGFYSDTVHVTKLLFAPHGDRHSLEF